MVLRCDSRKKIRTELNVRSGNFRKYNTRISSVSAHPLPLAWSKWRNLDLKIGIARTRHGTGLAIISSQNTFLSQAVSYQARHSIYVSALLDHAFALPLKRMNASQWKQTGVGSDITNLTNKSTAEIVHDLRHA